MAARLTRKEMKTDKFAMEVGQTVDYVAHHRRQLLIYGSIAVAVAAIGFGVYWYLGRQQTVRAQALADHPHSGIARGTGQPHCADVVRYR